MSQTLQCISNVDLYFSHTGEPWVERMILTPGETDATSVHVKRVIKASAIFCSNLLSSLLFSHTDSGFVFIVQCSLI